MKIENIQLADIKPFPKNAKLHPKEQIQQIKASIKEYGFNDPIAVSETNEIIEGHGRYIAVKELGYTEVPCIRLSHLTEAQRRAYILAHNKLTMNSGFDDEILLGEFDFLKDAGFGMELTGFDSKEIEKMFSANDKHEVQEDDFDVEAAVVKPPFVMNGDIWTLGRHRLMCGDSTKIEVVERLMGGKKAQILWADPPWNVNYGKAEHPSWKRREIMNDSMSTEDFYKFLHSAFTAMAAVSEAGAMVYIAMSAQEWPNVHSAMLNAGFHWSSTIIWAKDSLVLSRKDYHTKYEPLWYGWLDNGKRLCPLQDRQQSDLWEIPRPKRSDEHPTMKPVELVAKSLINSSRKGDIVLDLFGGSGTTLIAAEQTEREACLMELDPKYASVIVERFRKIAPDSEITVERYGKFFNYSEVVANV
jgi:DNA modification methylase